MSLVIEGNLILKIVLFLGFYKFYSWDGKGCCLISQMESRAKFGKKLIHLSNVSVFDDGLIVVNVIQLCYFVISSQIQITSLNLSLFAFFFGFIDYGYLFWF